MTRIQRIAAILLGALAEPDLDEQADEATEKPRAKRSTKKGGAS